MAETTAELIAAGKDVTKILTDPERTRLEECECIIRKGLGTFIEVGRALADIHDNRLYRETHNDFRRYCRDVWDLGKSSAYRKMDSYRVVRLLEDKMSPMGDILEDNSEENDIILPVNERQVRPLIQLKKDPEAQLKAWEFVRQTLKGNTKAKLTGALVNKAVKEVKGEVKKRDFNDTKKAIEATELISILFKRQCSILADIINEERNSGWKTTSRKEAVKRLKVLVQLAEDDG